MEKTKYVLIYSANNKNPITLAIWDEGADIPTAVGMFPYEQKELAEKILNFLNSQESMV